MIKCCLFVCLFAAPDGGPTDMSVADWMNDEKFPAFSLVAHNNINEIANSGKNLRHFLKQKLHSIL